MPTIQISIDQYKSILAQLSKREARKALVIATTKSGSDLKDHIRGNWSKDLAKRVKLDIASLKKPYARIRLKRVKQVSVRKKRAYSVDPGKYLALTRARGKSETPAQALRSGRFAATASNNAGRPVKGIFSQEPNARYRPSRTDGKKRQLGIQMYHRLVDIPGETLQSVANTVLPSSFPKHMDAALNKVLSNALRHA